MPRLLVLALLVLLGGATAQAPTWFEAGTDVGCVGDAVSDSYTDTLSTCESRAEGYDGTAIEW